MLDHMPIENIDRARLQLLVEHRIPEQLTLEYKRALPGGSLKERKEFLADVTAFANTAGGHIVYGIEELRESGKKTAIANTLRGLPAVDVEEAIHRLEQMILAGTTPALRGCRFHRVPLENHEESLVLRIPRSWAAPHAVTLEGGFRFWARRSNGKGQLNVPELRAAFLRSDVVAERIRRFRFERMAEIRARQTPLPITEGGAAVIHVVPFSSFDLGRSVSGEMLYNCRDQLAPTWEGLKGTSSQRKGYSPMRRIMTVTGP